MPASQLCRPTKAYLAHGKMLMAPEFGFNRFTTPPVIHRLAHSASLITMVTVALFRSGAPCGALEGAIANFLILLLHVS